MIYLRLALYLAPDHALARLTLADTLDRMKQTERANEAYAQIPATSPLKLNADIQIGLNLEQMGKGDEALAHLDAAMKAHPDDIDVIVEFVDDATGAVLDTGSYREMGENLGQ